MSYTQPPYRQHPTAMTKKPQPISPEEAKRRQLFYQKMAYIEMKKLRDAEFRKEHGWAWKYS